MIRVKSVRALKTYLKAFCISEEEERCMDRLFAGRAKDRETREFRKQCFPRFKDHCDAKFALREIGTGYLSPETVGWLKSLGISSVEGVELRDSHPHFGFRIPWDATCQEEGVQHAG